MLSLPIFGADEDEASLLFIQKFNIYFGGSAIHPAHKIGAIFRKKSVQLAFFCK